MTAILEPPVTTTNAPRALVSYRDLTPAQRNAWHTAEELVHDAEQSADLDAILTAWAVAAAALNVALSNGGELVECGCDCDCDRICDRAITAETVDTVGGVPTPICPTCWADHRPTGD